MILGLAIYNSTLLELHFPTVVYKKLLNEPVSFHDLKELDPDLHHGFLKMLEMKEGVENLVLTFSVESEAYGEVIKYELKVFTWKWPVVRID